ncbi:MAG: hypothetical protein JSW66_08670 [Phycisphaerales bacterium]|nr:MAG: hypothetical protein JSW66_08670 [Phycisphaerales bacterium]
MKTVNSHISYGIALCLFSVFAITNPTVVDAQPAYNLETDHISMEDLGALLERMGEEIQWKGQVTIGGNTYPVTGFGSIEMNVSRSRQGQGSSINFEISAGGREGLPTGGRRGEATTYVSYNRSYGGRRAVRPTTKEFAEILAKIGSTLESKGVFVIDDHSVPYEGKAKIVQKLKQTTARRGGGTSYDYQLDVMFGQKDFPMPQDEAEDLKSLLPEERELQEIYEKDLAEKEITGTDQKAVAKLFASLSGDLKAGRVRLDDQDLPAGENLGCSFSHLVALDGQSHRIRLDLKFGQGPPPPRRRTGPRYSEEFINKPIKQLGALLQRLGTELLEDGTMQLGENTFSVAQKASYEIKASAGNLEIGAGFIEPPKEE